METGKQMWEKLADNKPLMVVGSICSILGFPLAILSIAGVQMPWILDAIGSSSYIWLPVVTFITGFLAGWNVRKQKMEKDGITAERITKLEFYESEPERARAMFEGLTLNQISIAELAHGSKRDFTTQKSGHKYHAAMARPDVFVVFDRDDGSAVISLTDEWERMMNRYDDMFGKICRKRWSESK